MGFQKLIHVKVYRRDVIRYCSYDDDRNYAPSCTDDDDDEDDNFDHDNDQDDHPDDDDYET